MAQSVGRGIALPFLDRGTRRGWVVSSTPWPHFTPGKDPVPIVQETGWAPRPVWTGGKSRPHRDSITDRPARSWWEGSVWIVYQRRRVGRQAIRSYLSVSHQHTSSWSPKLMNRFRLNLVWAGDLKVNTRIGLIYLRPTSVLRRSRSFLKVHWLPMEWMTGNWVPTATRTFVSFVVSELLGPSHCQPFSFPSRGYGVPNIFLLG